LAGRSPMLTTYLLRRDAEPSETLSRFIDRVSPISAEALLTEEPSHTPESTKEINS